MSGKNSKEREAVKAAYPNTNWARRVDKMTDQQAIAVFMRLRQQGKI